MASFPTRRFAAQLALVAALVATTPALAQRKPAQKGKANRNVEQKAAAVAPAIAPAAAPVIPPGTVDPKVIDSIKPSVAFIDTKSGSGSGFLVLPNVVATNSHVIRDDTMNDVTVRFVDTGKQPVRHKPKLLYEDKARDLALLLIPEQEGRPILELWRSFQPGPKQTVFVVGNPGQRTGIIRVNAVGVATADETAMIGGVEFVQLRFANGSDAIDIGPGTSGGPALDPSGRVVGVLTMATLDGKGKLADRFYCVPASAVGAALAELELERNWDKVSDAATARHLLGIASINYYLTGKVATAVFDAREANARRLRVQWYSSNLPEVLKVNSLLTEAFRVFDRERNVLAEPAYRDALAKQTWPHKVRYDLIDMRDTVETIRRFVPKKVVSKGEYLQCKRLIEQNERTFRQLQKTSGLTDRVIDEMTENLLDKVLDKIGR